MCITVSLRCSHVAVSLLSLSVTASTAAIDQHRAGQYLLKWRMWFKIMVLAKKIWHYWSWCTVPGGLCCKVLQI